MFNAFAQTPNTKSNLRVNRNKVNRITYEPFASTVPSSFLASDGKSITQIPSFTNKNGRQRSHEPWENLQKSSKAALSTQK